MMPVTQPGLSMRHVVGVAITVRQALCLGPGAPRLKTASSLPLWYSQIGDD